MHFNETSIVIQAVNIQDVSALRDIAVQTFRETFAPHNTIENLDAYVNERLATARLLTELSNADSRFFFALVEGHVVGYLKVNFNNAQTEPQGPSAMEIERIYVSAAFHGRKVGRVLFQHALGIARAAGMLSVWLGVWEHNHRAVAFYRKQGFTPFDTHTFHFGKEKQTDLMMRLLL